VQSWILNDLHRQWYDWTMKGGPKPAFLKNQVAYYLLAPRQSGANGEWKYAENLTPSFANPRKFYLDSKNGDANGVFRSGALNEKQPTMARTLCLRSDGSTARRERRGHRSERKTAAIDQTFALSIGKDGLVYHTVRPNETPLVGCRR